MQALPKRVKFVREIIQEVMGYAPYEKRIMEVLKLGKEKRAQRFAKKRLGTHQRGVKVSLFDVGLLLYFCNDRLCRSELRCKRLCVQCGGK